MNGPPIVYLGPTLALSEAQSLLDADYRPPVKRGDLPSSCDRLIVMIDGEFGQSLSVSPNEILRLLDQGTPIIGASSMGALRAAELYAYGMQGCGWIFDAYMSGRLIADDEVAVTYSPLDLSAMTVPLVNVRVWLERLEAAGATDGPTARMLLARARKIFYADRTEEHLLAQWEGAIGADRLQRLLLATGGQITDIKAEDARTALAAASELISGKEKANGIWRQPAAGPAAPA